MARQQSVRPAPRPGRHYELVYLDGLRALELRAGPVAFDPGNDIRHRPGTDSHAAKTAIPEKPAEDPRATQEAKLASEMLLASKPVRLAGEAKNRARVEVILKDIYRKNNRVHVRYEIENKSRSSYVPGAPSVFTLRPPRSSTSLYTLSESQLLDGILISSQRRVLVTVLDSEVHEDAVAPGGATWGLVGFECPPRTSGPAVVEFAFPSDGDGEVSAVLVL
jgi:hypothetical protein